MRDGQKVLLGVSPEKIVKILDLENDKKEKIDFPVGDLTMKFVKWQKENYEADVTLFKIKKCDNEEDNEEEKEQICVDIVMEPYGDTFTGRGNTVLEAMEDSARNTIDFWKEFEKESELPTEHGKLVHLSAPIISTPQ